MSKSGRVSLLALICLVSAQNSTSPVTISPPSGPIPSSYFGMHNHHPTYPGELVSVPIGTIRLWDTGVNWPDLEPSRGVWQWSLLDQIISIAQQHQWQVILPLAFSPQWASSQPNQNLFNDPTRLGWSAEPASLQDWRDYVRAVATRYQGQVHIYEIWNEPNIAENWSGTTPQIVQLAQEAYAIIKAVDPTNVVISPSAAYDNGGGITWLNGYFGAGGGAYADIVGFHFYIGTEPPENLPTHIAQVQAVLKQFGYTKPLWNTEANWAQSDITFSDPNVGAAWLARAYIFNWASGIPLFSWYAWDNRSYVAIFLVQADLVTPTVAAAAYAQTEAWLSGSRMLGLASDANGNWTCRLQRPDGSAAYIVWNPSGQGSVAIPAGWKATQVRTLVGQVAPLQGVQALALGQSPQLIETSLSLTPSPATIDSAASLAAPIAPNSIATALGGHLALSTVSASQMPLSTTLGGTTVSIRDSGGASQLGLLQYVSSSQVNFVTPAGVAPGTATVTLTSSDGRSSQGSVNIAAVAPGIFTANGNGQGAVAGTVTTVDNAGNQQTQNTFACSGGSTSCVVQPVSLNSAVSAVLVLYGTGIRGRSRLAGVAASFCGQSLPVLYAGAQTQYPGLDQLNLALPLSLRGCGTGPLTLTVDGQSANTVQFGVQ